jgi:signal transduction histidine kinase
VRRRLLLGYFGVTLFVLASLELPLGIQNQRTERRDLTANVSHDATVLAADAEDAVSAPRPTAKEKRALAAVAYDYRRRTGGRVVIVDARGYALVDTSARVSGVEAFASRPEIRAALSGGYASGVRTSETLHQRLLYVAVPISSGGRVHGAVRVTYPLSAIDARILRYWLLLLGIAAVVLLGAALVGIGLARFVTRPLAGLETAAAAVGEGRLDVRAPEREGPPEVRSLAAVFNETVVKLAQLLRSQREFVEDASHELRTPLTALRLRLESLERTVEADGRADLEAAEAEVERLAQLVESLLALARADAGAAPPERVDAAAVARQRLETWRALAAERGVELTDRLDGAQPVRAGADRLAQVLDNLLSNALAAAPRGSAVTVSGRAAGPWLELHVRDEGPGMTADDRARAFDRFWRAPTAAGGGSGLGLAIVRRLVEADEGEVELADAPGGGLDAIVRLRRG